MTIIELIEQFIHGAEQGNASSVYISGHTIYSYGIHFPLAVRCKGANGIEFFVNSDKYSVTTSRQQTWLRGALLHNNAVVHFRDTEAMKHIAQSTARNYRHESL